MKKLFLMILLIGSFAHATDDLRSPLSSLCKEGELIYQGLETYLPGKPPLSSDSDLTVEMSIWIGTNYKYVAEIIGIHKKGHTYMIQFRNKFTGNWRKAADVIYFDDIAIGYGSYKVGDVPILNVLLLKDPTNKELQSTNVPMVFNGRGACVSDSN